MNLEEALAKINALEASTTQAKADAITAERTRIAAIIEAGKTTGMKPSLVEAHLKAGTSTEVASAIFLGIKEGLDATTSASLNVVADTTSFAAADTVAAQAASASPKILAGGLLSTSDLISALTQGANHA